MYNYFGMPGYFPTHPELLPTNNTVIVIRNPIDRMISAVKGLTPILHVFRAHKEWHNTDSSTTQEQIREIAIFKTHCKPYLSTVINDEFRIIDFYKIGNYITRPIDRKQSPVTNTSGLTNPKEHYVENSVFSLADLEEEYDLYLQIMNTREQISVEEWKSLTP